MFSVDLMCPLWMFYVCYVQTYTMIGSEACPGIMVLTLQDLFKQSALYSRQQGLTYKVHVRVRTRTS